MSIYYNGDLRKPLWSDSNWRHFINTVQRSSEKISKTSSNRYLNLIKSVDTVGTDFIFNPNEAVPSSAFNQRPTSAPGRRINDRAKRTPLERNILKGLKVVTVPFRNSTISVCYKYETLVYSKEIYYHNSKYN